MFMCSFVLVVIARLIPGALLNDNYSVRLATIILAG